VQRCLAVGLALVWWASACGARDLTPEVRTRLFAPTETVALTRAITRVPMRGTDHAGNRKCPYFQVYVNGQGPFTFLFDTGASYALVSSRVVQAANTKIVFDRNGQRDVVQLDRLSLGGVTLEGVWAIRDDNFGVDGIIGFPTLGMLNVLFDFSRRELLVSRRPIPMDRSFELPIETPFNVPTVPVRIGTRNVQILIDTGDDAYGLELRSAELGDTPLEYPPVAAGRVLNGATEQPTRVTRLKVPVRLGPVQSFRPAIAVNDSLPVGDFGYDALRQFRFQLQPGRRVVTFQPLFRGTEFTLAVSPPKTHPKAE
jgi:hypothetical protein